MDAKINFLTAARQQCLSALERERLERDKRIELAAKRKNEIGRTKETSSI